MDAKVEEWVQHARQRRLKRSEEIARFKKHETFPAPQEILSLRENSPMLYLVAQGTQR
ncbi:MAG: hypothetical protein JW893_06790 [Candidatus Omnitrophica bacterium]|nr:hypothetical protein [Candidatus Omnitrophota bacterium]